MGTAFRVKGTKLTGAGATAPKLALIDTILPDRGALMLMDPTHPYSPAPAGAANGLRVPNIALDQARVLIPAGDATTLAGVLYVPSAWGAGAGLAERTSKGGLHLMPSQVNGLDTNAGGQAVLGLGVGSSPFNAYMRGAGGLQNLYVALWGRVSRSGVAYTSGAQMHSRSDGSTQAYGFYNRAVAFGDTQYPTGATRLAHSGEGVTPTSTGTPFFQDIAVKPTLNSNSLWEALLAGGGAADQINKNAGLILYGYYVENLTESGRTYAQVNALVKGKYTKEVKTEGGRYYGDTWNSIA